MPDSANPSRLVASPRERRSVDAGDEAASERTATPYRRARALTPDRETAATLRPPLGLFAGAVCGLIAAVVYTLSNIALRQCVDIDASLVTAMKAAPTVVFLAPFVGWMWLSGQTVATSGRWVPRFILASLAGQLIGNGGFQISLGIIGLAATVPIMLGTLIVTGALLGRLMLGEEVNLRKVIAMITLICAVVILSQPGTSLPQQTTPVWIGAVCAAASGAAYAFFGATMRQALTGGLSGPATMLISGIVGSVSLWSITLLRLGTEPLADIAPNQWLVMVIAGVCNFTAFLSLSLALKSLPVVAVNLINASQVAMAAVAGVVLFSEPVTRPLVIGILLTCGGLLILASRRRPAAAGG